jgi:protein-tyrosine phosphatase
MRKPRTMLVQLHQNIYIRRHTKYVAAERLVKELQTKKVKLVLNVTPVTDPFFDQLAGTAGIMYCHVPMLDKSFVPIHDVQQLVQLVVEEVMRGNGVMIHCNQGNNRSPLIAILAIIKLSGCEPTEAVRQARKIRPSILKNKFFERYVTEHACKE